MFGIDIALLDGWFPRLLTIAAILALVTTIVRRDSRWWYRTVAPTIVAALILIMLVDRGLDAQARFGDVIPPQFVLYAAMPVIAVGLAAIGWRTAKRWRRTITVAAIPLVLLYSANLVNQYYSYEPTIGALLGLDLHHQVPPAVLQLDAETAATPLPSVRTEWRHGAVTEINIPGTVSGFHARASYVWVPLAFFHQPRPQLSVIVILAGTPGAPDNMIRAAHADEIAERYSTAHGGVAPILVFADGNGSFGADTECVDSKRGLAETYLTRDVPAFVERSFATASGPAHWAIEGFSEGGTCAAMLALSHPDVYGSFVDIAGDAYPNVGSGPDITSQTINGLYNGDPRQFAAHDPVALITSPAAHNVAGWFEAGRNDHRRVKVARDLDSACRRSGLESHLTVINGGHDFRTARHAIADSFAWLAGRIDT